MYYNRFYIDNPYHIQKILCEQLNLLLRLFIGSYKKPRQNPTCKKTKQTQNHKQKTTHQTQTKKAASALFSTLLL